MGVSARYSAAHDLVLDISRQLGAWVESLKNSEALNPRERNEAARQAAREAIRREAFLKELQRIARRRGHSGTGANRISRVYTATRLHLSFCHLPCCHRAILLFCHSVIRASDILP